MLQRMNLYFLGFTDFLLSFCFDGISKKRKNPLLSGTLLSFCVVCEIFLLYKFSDFLEKKFCHCSLSCQFFCHQAICIHSLLHPQPNIFIWKMLGHIWCADTNNLQFKSFQLRIKQCALCCCHCCGRVAMIVPGFLCTNGRSFLLQNFTHKKVV